MERPWTLLGAIAPGDQRLAMRAGLYYLYDNSGATPDRTDDGPLRIDYMRQVLVYTDGCSVPVMCARTHGESRVLTTHAGLVRLRELLPPGTLRIVPGSDEVKALRSLFKAIED